MAKGGGSEEVAGCGASVGLGVGRESADGSRVGRGVGLGLADGVGVGFFGLPVDAAGEGLGVGRGTFFCRKGFNFTPLLLETVLLTVLWGAR